MSTETEDRIKLDPRSIATDLVATRLRWITADLPDGTVDDRTVAAVVDAAAAAIVDWFEQQGYTVVETGDAEAPQAWELEEASGHAWVDRAVEAAWQPVADRVAHALDTRFPASDGPSQTGGWTEATPTLDPDGFNRFGQHDGPHGQPHRFRWVDTDGTPCLGEAGEWVACTDCAVADVQRGAVDD